MIDDWRTISGALAELPRRRQPRLSAYFGWQGRAEGRAEERALLCRQAARKFDAAAGQQLAAALAEVTDPDHLAEVGDWIIECRTAAELFARLADTPSRSQ